MYLIMISINKFFINQVKMFKKYFLSDEVILGENGNFGQSRGMHIFLKLESSWQN